jgi:hypothetical protein
MFTSQRRADECARAFIGSGATHRHYCEPPGLHGGYTRIEMDRTRERRSSKDI